MYIYKCTVNPILFYHLRSTFHGASFFSMWLVIPRGDMPHVTVILAIAIFVDYCSDIIYVLVSDSLDFQ